MEIILLAIGGIMLGVLFGGIMGVLYLRPRKKNREEEEQYKKEAAKRLEQRSRELRAEVEGMRGGWSND